jgi:pyruvate formate lyase activating enzyme
MTPASTPDDWSTPIDDGRVRCDLCPRHCKLQEGQRGFCFVRRAESGRVVLDSWGRASGFCVDPIEKKPLNHFFPGTSVLSFGTAGCNLGCRFCQNWDISKARQDDRLTDVATPEAIARAALASGCRSVAFTYNDPVIFAEYAIDTARAARAVGLASVAVTAGYITDRAREAFFDEMDAVNVDLKAFTEGFYSKQCAAALAPVLETLKFLARRERPWLEVTTLLIPGLNDSDEELRELSAWFFDHLGPRVPLHFTAFHPDFRLRDRPATSPATLRRARALALDAGLRHVYTGNVVSPESQTTYCEGCGAAVIGRAGYDITSWQLEDGACVHCRAAVPGRFDTRPGDWGPRRRRLRISGPS